MRFRLSKLSLAILCVSALVGIGAQLAAQTARDSSHVRVQKPPVDSVSGFLVRYCPTSSAVSYSKAACRNYTRLATNEAALTATAYPFPPACVRGDTTTSPAYTVVGRCAPETVDTSSRRYVSGSATSTGTGNAALVASPPTQWTTAIAGAQWIWKAPQVADPTMADTATFYQQFSTDATKPVTLDIAADNGYAVWINGRLMVDSLSTITSYQRAAHFVVPQTSLMVGVNTLLIAVRNAGDPNATSPAQNPAGVLYALTIGTPSLAARRPVPQRAIPIRKPVHNQPNEPN